MAKETRTSKEKASLQERLESIKKSGGKVMNAAVTPEGVTDAKTSLVKTQAIVTKLTTDIATEVEELEITSPQLYAYADELLGRIREGRGKWAQVWNRIQEKTIQPIRQGLEELYSLNRDVDKPAEALEAAVKAKMKAYDLRLLREKQEEEAARNREAQRLLDAAEEKKKLAAKATTPQAKGRLEKQAEQAIAAAEEVLEAPSDVVEVKAENSGKRTKPAWRIRDMEKFIVGVTRDYVPTEALMVNKKFIDDQFRQDPEAVESWPGIEVYDDIQIVGNRR